MTNHNPPTLLEMLIALAGVMLVIAVILWLLTLFDAQLRPWLLLALGALSVWWPA